MKFGRNSLWLWPITHTHAARRHAMEPTTKAEALMLSDMMAARAELSAVWAAEYRAKRRNKQAAQLDDLVRQFSSDAKALRTLAATLPE